MATFIKSLKNDNCVTRMTLPKVKHLILSFSLTYKESKIPRHNFDPKVSKFRTCLHCRK